MLLPMTLALGCEQNSAPSATGGDATAPSAAMPAPPSAAVSATRPHAALVRHGGVAASLFAAAHDLTLTDAQKGALDKIDGDLRAADDGVRTAMHGFRSDVQAGVKAGKLDTAKLSADDPSVEKAVADAKDKEAAALDSLHAQLDPAQRTSLVTAARAADADHDRRVEAWLKAKEADGAAVDWEARRLERLTADLSLDATQQKQAAAILTKTNDPPNAAGMQSRWDERVKRRDALFNAFEGATFDAKKADLSAFPTKTPREAIDHVVAFVSQLLPILHPDQRDKLAATLDRPFGAHEMPAGAAGGPVARHPIDDVLFPFSEPVDNAGGAPLAPTGSPTSTR
jgi:hypothetical protein